MEHDRSDDKTRCSSKRLKLDEEEDNENQIVVANAADGAEGENRDDANDDSPPSIFKLDIDCCEELFAYLPLEDLHSLGQTCKRMHQFTGYFVRENFRSTEFEWNNGNLWLVCSYENKMNGFIEFISNLLIVCNQLKRLAEFAPRFKSIRKLHLVLYDDQIDCIKEILPKCEEIDIHFDRNVLTIDLYEKILKFCTNIKHFKLNPYDGYFILKNNNWLCHEYPNLKYLKLYSKQNAYPSIAEMRTFFTLNKGIRKFHTNFWCLWECRHWTVDTDIKLDELLISCAYKKHLKREHIDLMNTLYERGFYKHLSLTWLELSLYESHILAKIRTPLSIELLSFLSALPPLDLKELRVNKNIDTAHLRTILTNNISTIERIHFHISNTGNVLFCIREFMKLKEIKLDYLVDVNSLNLAQLNEVRTKIVGAGSLTIYLSNYYYDAMGNTTKCGLIKLKRMN